MPETTTDPTTIPSLSVRLPADYYASPVVESKRLFPRAMSFGCGTAAICFLLLLFAGGAAVQQNGIGTLLDGVFSYLQHAVAPTFTSDVTPLQRSSFDQGMETLRGNFRSGTVPASRIQPLLRVMADASADNKVTGAEVEKVNEGIAEANAEAAKKQKRH